MSFSRLPVSQLPTTHCTSNVIDEGMALLVESIGLELVSKHKMELERKVTEMCRGAAENEELGSDPA